MASPETMPSDTQEQQEREAPVFESAEELRSPEKQLEQAMEEAKAAKSEFDPMQADVEMTRDQSGYAERLSLSPESIAEADEVIVGELSDIRTEEAGLLEKLSAKLRKYAGVAGLIAATTGSAAALENVTAEVPPLADDPKAVEVMSGDAMPTPEIPLALRMDRDADTVAPSGEDVLGTDTDGAEAPDREYGPLSLKTDLEYGTLLEAEEYDLPLDDVLSDMAANRQGPEENIAREEPEETTPEQILKNAEIERERAEEESYAREFDAKEFSSEAEIFEYFREGASRFRKEFGAMYAVNRDGSIIKAVGEFGSSASIAIENPDKIIKILKENDIEKVQFAHTHPIRSIESMLAPEYLADLKKQGVDLDHVPPSLPDIRAASNLYWSDIYDDPKSRSDQWWNAAKTENIVVDAGGVWKYKADYYHPYIAKQREAAVDMVLAHKEESGEIVNREVTHESLRALAQADPIILRRAADRVPKDIDYFDIMNARIGGDIRQKGEEYEYTEQQLDVLSASPARSGEAIEKFIGYCRERGIDISYTPFQKK